MLQKLYVNNFRCLQNFTLDLSDCRSALLIGGNGAGKPTVLECLGVLQQIGRGVGRAGDLIKKSDFFLHNTNLPVRIEVEIKLRGTNYKYALSVEWPQKFREARIDEERLSIDDRIIFSRSQGEISLQSGAKFGLDWHVFALPIVNLPSQVDELQPIKNFLASMVLVSPAPDVMTGFSRGATDWLDRDANNFAACLRGLLEKSPAAYNPLFECFKLASPDFLSFRNVESGEDGRQLMVTFGPGDSAERFDTEFRFPSAGEKCFFIGAYLVAVGRSADGHNINPPLPAFFVWDEPDRHLSLSELTHFIGALRKAANHGPQLLVTSHHPTVVRQFSDENTFLLERKSHLDPTRCQKLSDTPYTGDLIEALSLGEVTLS